MRLILCLLLVIPFVGCGQGLAPVSGVVTLDGEPLEGVRVVFAPKETDKSVNAGPTSSGTTDATGRYTLISRKGDPGAAVCLHRVGISFPALDESAVQAEVDKAYAKNPSISEAVVASIERKATAALTNKQKVAERYNDKSTLEFEVNSGGTDGANFDLKSDGT